MPTVNNSIIECYSRLADEYDDDVNLQSCWGLASAKALSSLRMADSYNTVLDVCCGTGRALLHLASKARLNVDFIGVDPATNMRKLAAQRTAHLSNVNILDGCFEALPIESAWADYLYSIFAFHWTTDLDASAAEVSRVLKRTGEMDLFFIGRNNGREFIEKTTPIFFRHMGPALLLASARMRKQLTKQGALELFAKYLGSSRLRVQETYETYYDSVEGHWGWWVRVEGHFVKLPPSTKRECYQEVRNALLTLVGAKGIPYTIHQLHVSLRRM